MPECVFHGIDTEGVQTAVNSFSIQDYAVPERIGGMGFCVSRIGAERPHIKGRERQSNSGRGMVDPLPEDAPRFVMDCRGKLPSGDHSRSIANAWNVTSIGAVGASMKR